MNFFLLIFNIITSHRTQHLVVLIHFFSYTTTFCRRVFRRCSLMHFSAMIVVVVVLSRPALALATTGDLSTTDYSSNLAHYSAECALLLLISGANTLNCCVKSAAVVGVRSLSLSMDYVVVVEKLLVVSLRKCKKERKKSVLISRTIFTRINAIKYVNELSGFCPSGASSLDFGAIVALSTRWQYECVWSRYIVLRLGLPT